MGERERSKNVQSYYRTVLALCVAGLIIASAVGTTAPFVGTVAASSHNVSSSESIGLASDIPGPIEYRGSNQYQVVVGFDRHINDTDNIDFRVTGINPNGNLIDTGRLTVSSSAVVVLDGVAGDGSALNNSVVRIRLGSAADTSNNIVTDGTLTVQYTGAAADFTKTFDIIETSAEIDAGNPSNSVVYAGERIAVYNLTARHNRYEVFDDGSFRFSGQSGDNTTVALEKTGFSGLTAGNEYQFEFLDGTKTSRVVTGASTVDIRSLGLDVALERAGQTVTYSTGNHPNLNLSATVASNVAARNIKVQLFENGDPVAAKLVNLRGGDADRETDIVFMSITPSGDVSNYSMRATDVETGITATSGILTVRNESQDESGPANDSQKFTYNLTLQNGTTHAIGFPGPINGTYGEVFGDMNGTIWAYDAATETWRHPDATESVYSLDAVYVIPEERATVTIDFADSESGPRAPGEKAVSDGWNFIGAPQYGSVEDVFAATTAEPKRILQVGSQPRDQPFRMGDEFGWYAFGGDALSPRVSAFTGYWVFMAENGTVGANLYRGVTLEEAEELLTDGGG